MVSLHVSQWSDSLKHIKKPVVQLKCLTCLFSLSYSRDERRWIEKQNRGARAQRKKEEMNRLRTLVGTVPHRLD